MNNLWSLIYGEISLSNSENEYWFEGDGLQGIDLNMGCPVANVAKKGKGSGLILRPERAAEIIQATKEGGLPVSVKTRLGYYEIDEWKDWLKHVFEQDIANLSIHLRTRRNE